MGLEKGANELIFWQQISPVIHPMMDLMSNINYSKIK